MQLWVGTEIPLQKGVDGEKKYFVSTEFKPSGMQCQHCVIIYIAHPHPQFVTGYHRIGRCFVVSAALPEAASHNLATSTSACPHGHLEKGRTGDRTDLDNA